MQERCEEGNVRRGVVRRGGVRRGGVRRGGVMRRHVNTEAEEGELVGRQRSAATGSQSAVHHEHV